MFIEHPEDRNTTTTRGIEAPEMTQTTDRQTATDTATDITIFQQAFVADHIAGLRREAAALRAERERDHRNEVHSSEPAAHHSTLDGVPTRVRVGHWLVAIGEAIAGPHTREAMDGDDASRVSRAV